VRGRIVRACGAVSVWAALVFGSEPGWAQSSNRVAAEALFRDARRLLDEGNYKEACEKLAASQHLDPAVGTLLNLARCYEKLGLKATAWETYRQAISAAKQSGQPDREKAARKGADALEPVLPQLTISVPPEARVASLKVTRDGVSVVPELWGATVPVDPGPHTVVASAPDRKDWSGSVVAEERQTKTVTIPVLEAIPAAPPAASPSPAAAVVTASGAAKPVSDDTVPPPERASYWNGQRTLAVIFGGVGVAGGVVAVVEALAFNDKKNQADKKCPTTCDDPALRDEAVTLQDEARTARTIGIVSGAVGGASLITGIVLWFTAPSGAPSTGKVTWTPVATTNLLGVRIKGDF
jgi:tetratricopeptide (TPR) repeat protein